MERHKLGRPSKGERGETKVRLPKDLKADAYAAAAARGMTFNDFVGELLADVTGTPYSTQGGIYLGRTAERE
jgi:predicted HicB family RNase H-like nuclease